VQRLDLIAAVTTVRYVTIANVVSRNELPPPYLIYAKHQGP
jgi:hypothetical protein